MSRLFSFPHPVNEISARLVATGVVLMAATTLLFHQTWILIPLTYGFLARVLTGPTLSPLGQLSTRVLTPRLPFSPRLVSGPPKRFAQGIGLVFSASALLLVAFHQDLAAYVLIALLLVAASLEAFLGLCLGCKVFALLMQTGLIPEETCKECSDIWSRPTLSSLASESA